MSRPARLCPVVEMLTSTGPTSRLEKYTRLVGFSVAKSLFEASPPKDLFLVGGGTIDDIAR
jgi:hypothetical protein